MAHLKCHFCGKSVRRKRYDQTTCSPDCNKAFKNLELTRAKRLYRCLYWWRYDRKGSATADNLRFIAREIRAWIDEDRAAGRPPPPRHDHWMDRGHQLRKAPATPEIIGIDMGREGDQAACVTLEADADGKLTVTNRGDTL